MEKKNLLWLLVGGIVLWQVSKKIGGGTSGLGIGGSPRLGKPKSEAERLATHKARYGETMLPPRGTGLKKRGII